MVMKKTEIVEITPDRCVGWKKMTMERKRIGKKRDRNRNAWTPFKGIPYFYIIQDTSRQDILRHDMKIVEEIEEPTVIDFDPNDAFDLAGEVSSTASSHDDVSINHVKGQVARRDPPHLRHLCNTFPFGSTQNSEHCNQCYCYVCDLPAPCEYWMCGCSSHCQALDDET